MIFLNAIDAGILHVVCAFLYLCVNTWINVCTQLEKAVASNSGMDRTNTGFRITFTFDINTKQS